MGLSLLNRLTSSSSGGIPIGRNRSFRGGQCDFSFLYFGYDLDRIYRCLEGGGFAESFG